MARRPSELTQSPESKTQIAVLTERVSNLIDDFEGANKETKDHRDRLTNILDANGEALRALTSQIAPIADIGKRVDALESKADHAAGVVWTLRGLWAAFGAGALAGIGWLLKKAGIICLIGGLVALAAVSVAFAQHRHPQADADLHEKFYSTWLMPNGGSERNKSCCDNKDCYPTAMKFERGNWYALRREDRRWLVIPPSKIEQNQADPREAPDHRSHACIAPPWSGEAVFCATLGSGI